MKVVEKDGKFTARGYTHNWASDVFEVKAKSPIEALTELRKCVTGDEDGEWLLPEIARLVNKANENL